MTGPVDTIDVDGVTVRVYYDEGALNPRTEFDRFGTIYYASSRYILGDKQASADEIQEAVEEAREGGGYAFPVFAYVHSGASLSLQPFGCPWDSGQSGYYVITKEEADAWYGAVNYDEKKVRETAASCLEEYTDYLNGSVYCYTVVWNGEEQPGVGGFYGFDYKKNGLLDHAKDDVAALKVAGLDPDIGSITVKTRHGSYHWEVPSVHESRRTPCVLLSGVGSIGEARTPEEAVELILKDARTR